MTITYRHCLSPKVQSGKVFPDRHQFAERLSDIQCKLFPTDKFFTDRRFISDQHFLPTDCWTVFEFPTNFQLALPWLSRPTTRWCLFCRPTFWWPCHEPLLVKWCFCFANQMVFHFCQPTLNYFYLAFPLATL